jgi:hypothetical protein
MTPTNQAIRRWSVLGSLLLTASACTTLAPANQVGSEAAVRAAEKERFSALVNADMASARPLHASDFQVISPLGKAISRESYLTSVASGEIDYLAWIPGEMDVRLEGRMAAIRYRSRVDLIVGGRRLPPWDGWSTGIYVYRNGRWQILWFQVTEVAQPR